MIKRLAKSIREYKKASVLTLLFMVGEAIVESFIPFITADLVNTIRDNAGRADTYLVGEVTKTGALLVLMAVLSLICGGSAAVLSSKAASGFGKNLRKDMFHKIQTYNFQNIDKFSSASLVTRITTDVTFVQMSYMMIIRTAVRSPLMILFSVIMSCAMGGKLAISFVFVIPFLAGGLFAVSRFAMPAFHKVFKKYDKLNESIEENVRGARVVKGFSREEYEKEKFDKAAVEIRKDFTTADRIVALNNPIMNICMNFIMIFVLSAGSLYAVRDASIDVGQISAMITYGVQVLMSLMMLSMIYVMITISAESAKRICEVLEEEPVMSSPENALTEVADGSIVFDNVSFKYNESAQRPTLENINLRIDSGMTVGILGGTGAGKTSLVQLIPRLYDVSSGSVTVGGKNVKEYDIETLRQSVAMVLQKNLLFSGTIKENLLWGDKNASDEDIIEACKLACAHDFVQSFPDGYDTFIEQGGTNVSGGQKQRLCIARALLKKPKILILDDSTSAVDTKTDSLIREGFRKFIPATTKIIIAQRVASVQDADLIVVMDNGAIIATGTHDELLANCDIYKEIYEQQVHGGDDDAE